MESIPSLGSTQITLHFTHQSFSVDEAFALLPLSDFIRQRIERTGLKKVCSEGDCGSCTCVVQSPLTLEFKAINTCLTPLFSMHEHKIWTLEDLSSCKELSYREFLEPFEKEKSFQCGFCTSGVLMSLAAALQIAWDLKEPTFRAQEALNGTLCRCTGYLPIWRAIQSLKPFPILPIIDTTHKASLRESKRYQTSFSEIFMPSTLIEALQWKKNFPESVIFNGGTDLMIQWDKQHKPPSQILSLQNIKELNHLDVFQDHLVVGSTLSLSSLERSLQNKFPEFHSSLLSRFASTQIKNQGTLAGNLCNCSPISDTLPLLMVLNTELTVASLQEDSNSSVFHNSSKISQISERIIPISDWIAGAKKTSLLPSEILTAIRIPLVHTPLTKVRFYKISQRKDLDIAIVNIAFFLQLIKQKDHASISASASPSNLASNSASNLAATSASTSTSSFSSQFTIGHFHLAVGGVASTVLRLRDLENQLQGKVWSIDVIEDLASKISNQIYPWSDHRGSASYRLKLVQNLIFKFFHEVSYELQIASDRPESLS